MFLTSWAIASNLKKTMRHSNYFSTFLAWRWQNKKSIEFSSHLMAYRRMLKTATSSIFHPHAANKCSNFSAANLICGPIYVECFIHVQQNAAINFEIMLKSCIIKDGLKEKTSSLYCSARWRGGNSIGEKSNTKHLCETVAPKKELGIYSNLFQELVEAKSLRDYDRMDKIHSDYLVERFHPNESKKKESKKNIFCREQKNSFCNIKCFKKLLTSIQKNDL